MWSLQVLFKQCKILIRKGSDLQKFIILVRNQFYHLSLCYLQSCVSSLSEQGLPYAGLSLIFESWPIEISFLNHWTREEVSWLWQIFCWFNIFKDWMKPTVPGEWYNKKGVVFWLLSRAVYCTWWTEVLNVRLPVQPHTQVWSPDWRQYVDP